MTKPATAIKPHVAQPGDPAQQQDPDTCQACRAPAVPSDLHHPPGATLHLGGTAWANPTYADHLTPIAEVLPHPDNPRRGDQDAITSSIRDLGLYRRIITQTSTGYTLAGNHTTRALHELGATMAPADPWDVPDHIALAVVHRDNHTSDLGTYDDTARLDLLTALDQTGHLSLAGPDARDLIAELEASLAAAAYTPPVQTPTLADRFVIPPFTVLDARSGAWQERKRRWLALGIQSEVGRGASQNGPPSGGEQLPPTQGYPKGERRAATPAPRKGLGALQTNLDGEDAARYGREDTRKSTLKGQVSEKWNRDPQRVQDGRTLGQGLQAHRDPATGELVYTETTAAGVSIFDPVLCELAYRWFSPPDGHVLDPFAGGSVRGIIAAALGRTYTGIELRPEQVAANRRQADDIIPRLSGPRTTAPPVDNTPALTPVEAHAGVTVPATTGASTWLEGDSLQVLPGLDTQADLIFSCPPYADLEVYSDDPADLSAMPYDQFLTAYRAIIAAAAARLRDDRYAVWVIGEVRDKRGEYRGLVPDTIRAFTDAGLSFYNEAILVTPVGSLPIRAGRQFAAGRKLGKTHQQVLVFCKGDPRAAADACGTVEVTMPETEEADPLP